MVEIKTLDRADQTRTFDRGKVDVSTLGSHNIGRVNFEPGWSWSSCVKPIVGGDSCQTAHVGYLLQGRLGVRMNDGSEYQIKAGDAYSIEPGHDGWVEGTESVVGVEFESLRDYAKPRS
jgi:hypothetical protein